MLIAIDDFITQVLNWLSAHWQPLVSCCLAVIIFRLVCLNHRQKEQINEFERLEKKLRQIITDREHENVRLRQQCSIQNRPTEKKKNEKEMGLTELIDYASHLPYPGPDDSV